MADYTNNYGSEFPNVIMTQQQFKDLDDSCATIVNEFNALISDKKYSEAQALVAANPDLLKNRFLTASVINWLFEEIRNAQVFAKTTQQSIYETYDGSEPQANVEDSWIGIN